MITSRYQQVRPIAAFRHLVDAYWINRPDAGGAAVDRVLPDGCIDLIFRGDRDGGGRLFASALIEQPVFFGAGNPAWFVGVRFRPAMARAMLDIDPVECRGRDTLAAEIDPAFTRLEDRLCESTSAEAALALLTRAVEARLTRSERNAAPMRVREALALLARGGDAAQIAAIARALGMSERSLHRLLVRWSGLPPKSMARILRMQRALRAIRTERNPLAEVALQLGYADQAHMTRELKSLAGLAPSEIRPRVRNLQDTGRAAA
jgi:AraC-like DNA-binding protein